ncbi:DUF58 domain-containing protein [Haloferax sp. S1W]|uniref:DUF58 domain-containing protein n=1 Tax=Haloferax sp. S1W TaxID=3377110 RepID=UPI0037CB6744
MRVTRRFWEVAGVGGFLCVLAVVLQRPFLAGAAGILAVWLLVRQYLFTTHLRKGSEALSVTQTASRTRVITDEPFLVTLSASIPQVPSGVDISVRSSPPLAATTESGSSSVQLSAGDTDATTSYRVAIPTAGVGRFDRPEVTLRSADGLFEESLSVGDATTVTVEPRAPRRVHVGEGGQRISTGYGEHTSDQRGSGIEPAEIRQYVHGDDISRIDWKATARLNQPHIRDYQVPTAQQTALVVDHRASTRLSGVDGSALDYLREVSLAFLNSAAELDDPVGLYSVSDHGSTHVVRPRASDEQYRRLRQRLHNLSASAGGDAVGDTTTGSGSAADATTGNDSVADRTQPTHTRHFATAIVSDSSQYSETLYPYFRATDRYVERFSDKPLFSAVKRHLSRVQGSVQTLIFTDDTNRGELYEAVKVARKDDSHVLVFITPRILFDQDAFGNLEAAYREYQDFERFRTQLSTFEGVSAFEVGPADRLAAILNRQQHTDPTASTR